MPDRTPFRLAPRLLVVTAAVGAVLAVSGCTPARSVEAYCAAVKEHKQRYLTAMESATSQGGIAGLITGGAAIGDLASMWDDLAKVAPDEIQTDSERVRDAWQKIQDDAAEKKVLAAATAALATAASMQRVNAYIADHCGVDAAPIATGRGGTASPAPTASSAVSTQQLVKVADPRSYSWDVGPRGLIAFADDGDDGLTLTTTSVVGRTVVSETVDADAPGIGSSNGDGNVVRYALGAQQLASADPGYVVVTKAHTAASGLTPESWSARVAALDARSSSTQDPKKLSFCAEQYCSLTLATRFGDTAVIGYSGGATDAVAGVDLRTGSTTWVQRGFDAVATADGLVVLERQSDGQVHDVIGVDAQSGSTTWTFHDRGGRPARAFGKNLGNGVATVYTDAQVGLQETARVNLVDLRTGKTFAERYGSMNSGSVVFDPADQRIVLAGYADSAKASLDDGQHFEVLDTTGRRIFSIPAQQYAQLGSPGVLGVFGGSTWLDTSNGVDLIDTDTGEQSPDSPELTGTSSAPVVRQTLGSVLLLDFGDSGSTWVDLRATGAPSLADVQGLTAEQAS